MVEDLKKGQPKINTLDQKRGSNPKAKDMLQTLKTILPLITSMLDI